MPLFELVIEEYTDTVRVQIDGNEIEMKPLFFKDAAKYECNLSEGLHNIVLFKDSNIKGKNWKTKTFADALSFMLGVPNGSLRNSLLDMNTNLFEFNINLVSSVEVVLTISRTGIHINKGEAVCKTIKNKTTIDKTAKRRVNLFYVIPLLTIMIVLVGGMFAFGVSFIVHGAYKEAILMFILMSILGIIFFYGIRSSYKK